MTIFIYVEENINEEKATWEISMLLMTRRKSSYKCF